PPLALIGRGTLLGHEHGRTPSGKAFPVSQGTPPSVSRTPERSRCRARVGLQYQRFVHRLVRVRVSCSSPVARPLSEQREGTRGHLRRPFADISARPRAIATAPPRAGTRDPSPRPR